MKKILISVLFIGAFGSYALYNYYSAKNATAAAPVTTTTAAASATVSGSSSASAGASAPPTSDTSSAAATRTTTGEYKDGTYTGTVANAFYGNIQVAAVISGGQLTAVNVLQYPNDRGESVQINDQALPILKAEAIKAQSATVDAVSSASQTSEAFSQSLSSALTQAQV